MNKNTKTYLLLTLVLLIWGLIGYKVFSGNSSNSEDGGSYEKPMVRTLTVKEKDTFSILADYRDPFLGTFPKKQVKKVKRTLKSKKPPMPEIKVQFTGLVTDKDGKRNIFFVTIDGQQHLMGPKDEINKVKLVSGNANSISIRINGKTRTIPLTE
ncbi:hypothetical protein [Spongiimicrobium sp. 3-5]|uniref:hypothetical protein n=1 Tax=Spongiimicrobium sp. 3-5 TaxID=3332596 RepID=UPI00397F1499